MRSLRRDDGVYAILYAVLVVVLLGMGAIVVDLAMVRQDRRLDRSAADSAALAGVSHLNTLGPGASPYQGCLSAWAYIADSLGVAVPTGACGAFASYTTTAAVNAYCPTPTSSPAEIVDDRNIPGDRTVRIAWPIPYHPGAGGVVSQFLTPEIAPGSVSQTFDTTVDGTEAGCDRMGVAIFEDETFGLGSGVGINGTTTQVHSVARFSIVDGPVEGVSALNVLNPTDCSSLITTGNGQVLVGAVVDGTTVVGPGSIAVEAAGTNSTCNGGKKVIDPTTGAGSLVCASSVRLVGATSCDGLGVIQSHALDPGGNPANAYSSAAVNSGVLKPTPTPEGFTHSWNPVTKLYGCNTTYLAPCDLPPAPQPNYVALLEAAYKTSGTPTLYTGSQAPYTSPYTLPFGDASVLCGNTSTIKYLPPGNWYADCDITVRNGGMVIIQGGNLVLGGDINVNSGGCFVMNVPVETCSGLTTNGATDSTVTSSIPPLSDSVVYLRNGSIDTAGTLVMPQTFVYSRSNANNPVSVQSTELTLWTAPGAGAKNGNGRTMLEEACFDPTAAQVVKACMNSRFARMAYWSDYPIGKTPAPNNFAGQGSLNVVGVFFTPRGYFNFTGGGAYAAAAAQFWADKLNVNGGAVLGLIPDAKFAIESPQGRTGLIR